LNADFSFWHLVLSAGLVVKAVMLLLVIASVVSWAIIFAKNRQISRATRLATAFENEFWSGADANQMYQHIRSRDGHGLSGIETVFERGFSEYARLVKDTDDSDTVVEGSYRAMKIALSRETDSIEQHTAIGLFAAIPAVVAYNRLSNMSERLLNRYDNFMDEFAAVLQRQVLRRNNSAHR